MGVLVAVDSHIQTQMDSDLTEVKRSMLTSVSDTLRELLQLAKVHEGRTSGLVKFALSSRMQKLVADATQKASKLITKGVVRIHVLINMRPVSCVSHAAESSNRSSAFGDDNWNSSTGDIACLLYLCHQDAEDT